MAYGPLKRGPQADDPLDRLVRIRCTGRDLAKIEELARDGVTLPARTIPAGVSKRELVRLALGLTDAEPPRGEPGKSAVAELQRRLREGSA